MTQQLNLEPDDTTDQIIVVSRRYNGTKAPSGYSIVPVDRSTPLGNPFVMNHEHERDKVCNKHEAWFKARVVDEGNPRVRNAFLALLERARKGEKLALECWCAPKRCHGDTIKRKLEEALRAPKE